MMDVTLEKRADRVEAQLHDLSTHERVGIDEISYYKTRAFEDAVSVRDREFTPCELGFSWGRDRRTEPADRFDADVELTDASGLPESLSVGTNVWFALSFTVPERMAGRPVYL